MRSTCLLLLPFLIPTIAAAQETKTETRRGDAMVAEYFQRETERLAEHCLSGIDTLEDWQAQRDICRGQLLEMLGLQPLPEKTPLQPVITSTVEHEDIVVEQLHYQSRPGLYVTGNLYRPKEVTQPLPAILYVCGHGRVVEDGVSYGNKVHYQHHGAWFARNGYVCLTIDTLQLGEILGIHHGTHRYDRWWWLNHGYTPAGVEAWNCVRALDYLETRPEVDASRLGVTGRSGGGAYSWWIAAIDDRIRVAVPVAGITDLENHVVDGTVEGHCDCMFMVNTYRWDYPLVAALVAPRPLLISNTDTDRIFPLDGVVRIFEQVRRIYALHDGADQVALNITAGVHKDTQELRVHAFRWFNQHLRDDDGLVEKTAVKFFEPPQLKVFGSLPEDERNTKIDESFVRLADDSTVPQNAREWQDKRASWLEALTQKSFRGWPAAAAPLQTAEAFRFEKDGLTLRGLDFTSQHPFRLRIYLLYRSELAKPDLTVLNVLDESGWAEFLGTARVAFDKPLADEAATATDPESFAKLREMLFAQPWCMAYVAPRGIGPTAWDASVRKRIQHRRRFYLLGQSLDGMRVYDTRRAFQALRATPPFDKSSLWLQGRDSMAGVALYASLFEPEVARLDLYDLPTSHDDGPLLNVSRILDLPSAVAMAAENAKVVLYQNAEPWSYPRQVTELLGRQDQLQFRDRNVRPAHGSP